MFSKNFPRLFVFFNNIVEKRLTHDHKKISWNLAPRQFDCQDNYYHQDRPHEQLRLVLYRYKAYPRINLHSCAHQRTFSHSAILIRSIFKIGSFGRWVITHSSAGFDLHDHRPTVLNSQLYWTHVKSHLVVWIMWKMFPRRQICLPKVAHLDVDINVIEPFQSLKCKRFIRSASFIFIFTRHICDSSSYPVGNFNWNQQPGDSMSLSPLCSPLSSDLHVSITSTFHGNFSPPQHRHA